MFSLAPLRLYAYAAVALVIVGLGIALKVQSQRLETAQLKLSVANSANTANLETIDAQSKALAKWRSMARSPEDIQVFIDEANKRAAEVKKLQSILASAKGRDRDLPDCISLLSISLESRCPSIAAGLRHIANEDNHGGGTGAGGATSTTGVQ